MSIPIKKRGMHRVPWWTTEIGCMRKYVNDARRRFQRRNKVILKEIYKCKYQELRTNYNLELLEAKISSWKKFLDEINVNNLWEKIYTFGVKQQFQKRVKLSGIALPSGLVTKILLKRQLMRFSSILFLRIVTMMMMIVTRKYGVILLSIPS
ncbi:reverse transcriptase domain-containing protein [Trichonephila clavipes]|nr:reverse transcriptase domain-containing protein [Trichonephila clavipes]